MNIYCKKGARVRFIGRNGYDHQLEAAMKLLTVDAVYTVNSVNAGDWSSGVFLDEFPGISFNTVMFEDAKEPVAPVVAMAA